MYLDTDPILACLKVEDWLKSSVSLDSVENPVTSTATVIEIQYVMEDDWSREELSMVSSRIEEEGIRLVPLRVGDIESAEMLRERHSSLGVFDSIHLGAAYSRSQPIVSTDTLYPSIDEIEHIDPRDLGN